MITKLYDKPNLQSYISDAYRKSDIRHCYADIQRASSLEDRLTELAGWAKTHEWDVIDLFEKALHELRERRLAA